MSPMLVSKDGRIALRCDDITSLSTHKDKKRGGWVVEAAVAMTEPGQSYDRRFVHFALFETKEEAAVCLREYAAQLNFALNHSI